MSNKKWTTFTGVLPRLRNSKPHSQLTISPTELDPISIVLIICIFIVRTIKSALGFGTRFIPVKANDSPSSTSEQDFSLPNLTLSMPLEHTPAHNALFAQAINPISDESVDIAGNNAQICLFLAALSEPALLLLLGKQGCPVRPLGAVNVRNRFELLEPELCRSIFGSAGSSPAVKRPGSMSVLARFSGSARRVRRGLEIDVEVDIILNPTSPSPTTAKSEPQTIILFRQVFTMLQFMKFKSKSNPSQPKDDASKTTGSSQSNQYPQFTASMPPNSPYAWAHLCKDYNPIHFSPFLAKLLGQPGQLAHGNHAVGVCIHTLSNTTERSSDGQPQDLSTREQQSSIRTMVRENMIAEQGRWSMETRFRRPIVLPASIGAVLHDTGEGDGFDIVDTKTGRVCVEVDFGVIS